MRILFARIMLLSLVLGGAVFAADDKVKVIALFSGKALLQVGDQQKIVSNGETFEGVLLKSATGRGAVVVIDGRTTTLGLNQSAIAGVYKKPSGDRARVYPDASGMYYTNGRINGKTTRFLIDTGATDVAISGSLARQLKIDFRGQGAVDFAETASQRVPVFKIKLSSVSIGGIKLHNVDAIVIPGEQPSVALLGNSFLSRTQMIKAGSVLEIKKRY